MLKVGTQHHVKMVGAVAGDELDGLLLSERRKLGIALAGREEPLVIDRGGVFCQVGLRMLAYLYILDTRTFLKPKHRSKLPERVSQGFDGVLSSKVLRRLCKVQDSICIYAISYGGCLQARHLITYFRSELHK